VIHAERGSSVLGYTMLLVLPAAIAFAVVHLVVYADRADGPVVLTALGAAAVGMVAAGFVSWHWSRMHGLSRWYVLNGLVNIFFSLGGTLQLRGWRLLVLPAAGAMVLNAFFTGICVTGMVVTVLWMAGRFHFGRPPVIRHLVTVWEIPGSDRTDRDDSYQARCECEWVSRQFPLGRPGAEDDVFAAARKHSPNVARLVVVPDDW
jgi:hypothetical protein